MNEAGWDDSSSFQFEIDKVPPPEKPVVQPDAAVLGLLPGLRVEPNAGGTSRCSVCDWPIGNGAPLVWVPSFVRPGDSAEKVTEECRLMAYNGSFTGWCLSCAAALGRPEPKPSVREKPDEMSWPMAVVMVLGSAVVVNLALDGEWLAAWAAVLTIFAGLFVLAELRA